MEKISVIIPAYNAEKYLEQCVKSVQSQIYDSIEIIIVNDGSTDRTAEILEPYIKGRTRELVPQEIVLLSLSLDSMFCFWIVTIGLIPIISVTSTIY